MYTEKVAENIGRDKCDRGIVQPCLFQEAWYSVFYVNVKFITCPQKKHFWEIKTFSEEKPYCKQMNTNTRMLAEQTKTLETFYKTHSTSAQSVFYPSPLL